MQVRNVAADIIRDMTTLAATTSYEIDLKDRKKLHSTGVMVNASTKFLLPFGGRLLERSDGYWHVSDEDRKLLHLPYSNCLFVFNAEYGKVGEDEDKPHDIDYTAILCLEDTRQENGGIICIPLVVTSDQEYKTKMWAPLPVMFVIERKTKEELIAENPKFMESLPKENDALHIKYMHFREGDEEDLPTLTKKFALGVFVDAVVDVLRIMQCSNVVSEVIPGTGATKQVNDKRINKGKSPLYEYRQLTVDVSGSTKEGSHHYNGSGGKRRQHLRRGHIRRYQSGVRIWVQSHIVGAGAIGRVDKEYNLKAAHG